MDLRLLALMCLAFMSVHAKRGRKPFYQRDPKPVSLEQEILDFLNYYYKAFVDEDMDVVAESWTEDAEILVTAPGVPPLYGKEAIVQHYGNLLQHVIDYDTFVMTVDGHGEVHGTDGQVVWATGQQFAYGEEQYGTFGGLPYQPNDPPIYNINLTVSWVFERNICDGGLRFHTAACAIDHIADWLVKYG